MQQQILQAISTGPRHLKLLTLALAAAIGMAPLQGQAQTQVPAQVPAPSACPAGGPPPIKQEFRRSQAVVMGHVIETVNHAAAGVIESTDYTFMVDRQLKGKRVRTMLIHAKNNAQRFRMNEQRRYMLFVSQGKDNKWVVNQCGNSALIARPVEKPPAATSQR